MKTKIITISMFTLIISLSGCSMLAIGSPADLQPMPATESLPAASYQPTASPVLLLDPTMAVSTVEHQMSIPAGWIKHISQQCEYAISHPVEIQVTDRTPYSEIFMADPEKGLRNFFYVSVISPEIQNKVKAGAYLNEVYNYDPQDIKLLLGMQVGESRQAREFPEAVSGFTYQRKPDTQIGGYTAQTYENLQPWEFPAGTKEIRYYLSANDCIYQIGGYLDTTRSDQPGAITEDLFNQIVSTIRLIP